MKNPFRNLGNQCRAEVVPDVIDAPAEVGARILARYQHPDGWREGESIGKFSLAGQMVLKLEEVRIGGMGFVSEQTAHDNADAIRAWAGSVGLAPHQLTIDQQQDKTPYVIVPGQYFEQPVLPHLQALTNPHEQAQP